MSNKNKPGLRPRNNPVVIERRGFQEFDIGGNTFTVDVFKTQADLAKLHDISDEHEWLDKVSEVIVNSGGPAGCSGAECIAFNNHVVRLAKEGAGFFDNSASPPPPTDSTSSD